MGARRQLICARTADERRLLEQQIEHTDIEIDQLVYKLYELKSEEVALIEHAVTVPTKA